MFKRFGAAAAGIFARRQSVYAVIACVMLLAAAIRYDGNDYLQLHRALQLELEGKSGYGPEMDQYFRKVWPQFAHISMAYPLPAMWLALPLLPLPEAALQPIFALLSLATVVVGMWLLRMPWPLLYFLPLLMAFIELNPVLSLVGLALIGIWAARERRWWLLGIIVALTVGSKPQGTLLFGAGLALIGLRAKAWPQLLLPGLVLAGVTWLLEPAWVQEWLVIVGRYGASVQAYSLLVWVPVALALLVGCADLRSCRLAWLVVAGSWLVWLVEGVAAPWLSIGLCYVLPLIAAYLTAHRTGELPRWAVKVPQRAQA
jgi:hypothetical protein